MAFESRQTISKYGNHSMKLFRAADRYCKESGWKTLALLKSRLFSIGDMIGTLLPKEKKKLPLKLAPRHSLRPAFL